MSVSSADLVFYGSLNMPESGVGVAGGAIDVRTKVVFDLPGTGNTLNYPVYAQNLTHTGVMPVVLYGRNSAGVPINESGNMITGSALPTYLQGLTAYPFTQSFERILKFVVGNDHPNSGTVVIALSGYGAGTGVILSAEGNVGALTGITTVRRPFYNIASNPTAPTGFYEKIFLKNNNTSFALLDATISEHTGQAFTGITCVLATGQNDGVSVADRSTAPTSGLQSPGTFSHLSLQAIPGTNLGTGSGIGIWMNLTLASGASAAKATYQLNVVGNTT